MYLRSGQKPTSSNKSSRDDEPKHGSNDSDTGSVSGQNSSNDSDDNDDDIEAYRIGLDLDDTIFSLYESPIVKRKPLRNRIISDDSEPDSTSPRSDEENDPKTDSKTSGRQSNSADDGTDPNWNPDESLSPNVRRKPMRNRIISNVFEWDVTNPSDKEYKSETDAETPLDESDDEIQGWRQEAILDDSRNRNDHDDLSISLGNIHESGTSDDDGVFQNTESPIVDAPVTLPEWKSLRGNLQSGKPLGKKALKTQEREQTLTKEKLTQLHRSLNGCPGKDELADDPKGLKVNLMPHQRHALAWLLWREKQRPHGGILADDMGLGKTLTMISLILASRANEDSDDESEDSNDKDFLDESVRLKGGTLVVCPASLLSQWELEINTRVKHRLISVRIYHGNKRETNIKRLAKVDMVLTTYNLISRENHRDSLLCNINWKRIILDEAHIVRNHKTQASDAVCNLSARYRWALTGTPIHNKELDLFGLLKFLRCSPFDDINVWRRWVDKNDQGQERLTTVMKTLMLRRTKIELQAKGGLGTLPDKSVEEITIKLDPEEQLVYEKILVFSHTLFAQFLHQRAEKEHMAQVNAGRFDAPTFLQKPKDTNFTKVQQELLARCTDVKTHEILVLLLRLRQICCHPALVHSMLDRRELDVNGVEDEHGVDVDLIAGLQGLNLEQNEDEIGVDRRVTENLLTTQNPVFNPERQSSKMRAVLETIRIILDKGDKIVVVSQWTSLLEVVRSHLKSLKGATHDILAGSVPVNKRQRIVESFNKVRSAPQILLLSLTAGGVGLNLVGGNHLLLLDIHWNPQLEAQAQDRIYRVGQTKSVYIYKFLCLDTIEQRIKALQEAKEALAKSVLTGAGSVGAAKLSLDDLKSLFSL